MSSSPYAVSTSPIHNPPNPNPNPSPTPTQKRRRPPSNIIARYCKSKLNFEFWSRKGDEGTIGWRTKEGVSKVRRERGERGAAYGTMNWVAFSWIINFKMSRSVMSWGNLESSVDFNNNLYEWSNRFAARLREESISGGLRLAADPSDDSCPPSLFAHENAINFADIADRALLPPTPTPLPTRIINQTRDTDISKWAPTPALTRRGLKHLASLLLRVILSENCTSHREIAAGVERLLSTSNPVDSTRSRMERVEEKNLKRRIYDALNVMISARVLERSLLPSEKSSQQQLVFKNYNIADSKQELSEECVSTISRLTRKKELLAKLESQHQALRRWRDRRRSPKPVDSEVLEFPLISLLRTKSSKVKIGVEGDILTIIHNNLEINSETDMLEEVYRVEVEGKERRTACKEEDIELIVG